MQARVKWNEGMSFVVESGSGHALVVDGAPEYGGRNLGPRPMELVLMGAGACAAFDVVLILKKARQPIVDVQVSLDAERAETDPKVFTAITMHFKVFGRGLNPVQVERAVQLSKDKYCSATAMLGKTAEVKVVVEIVESV